MGKMVLFTKLGLGFIVFSFFVGGCSTVAKQSILTAICNDDPYALADKIIDEIKLKTAPDKINGIAVKEFTYSDCSPSFEGKVLTETIRTKMATGGKWPIVSEKEIGSNTSAADILVDGTLNIQDDNILVNVEIRNVVLNKVLGKVRLQGKSSAQMWVKSEGPQIVRTQKVREGNINLRRTNSLVHGVLYLTHGSNFDFINFCKNGPNKDLKYVCSMGGARAIGISSEGNRAGVYSLGAVNLDTVRNVPDNVVMEKEVAVEKGGSFIVQTHDGRIIKCRIEDIEQQGLYEAIIRFVYNPNGSKYFPLVAENIKGKFDGKSIVLIWNKVASDIDKKCKYNIYRRTYAEYMSSLIGETEDTTYIDTNISVNQAYCYEVSRIDEDENESDRSTICLASVRKALNSGVIEMKYRQGYTFSIDKISSSGLADFYFSDCAGGISSIGFSSTGGLFKNTHKRNYIEINKAPEFGYVGQIDCDSRLPEENIFYVKTLDGGYAKCKIIHRETAKEQIKRNGKGWQDLNVKIKYTFNPLGNDFIQK